MTPAEARRIVEERWGPMHHDHNGWVRGGLHIEDRKGRAYVWTESTGIGFGDMTVDELKTLLQLCR